MKTKIRNLIMSIIIYSTISLNFTFGQSIEVITSLNTSSNVQFQSAIGLGINYQYKPVDSLSDIPFQFGVSLNINYCQKKYDQLDDVFPSGRVYYSFDQITSKVERTSFRVSMVTPLRNNHDIYCGIGFDFSLNLLTGNYIEQRLSPDTNYAVSIRNFSGDFDPVLAFGMGILARLEIKNVWNPRLSLCFNIRPEFIYSPSPTMDSDSGNDGPSFKGFNRFTEFQIGLKYNIH